MRNLLLLPLLLCLGATVQDADETLDNWHQFRGPTGNGTAPNADPPTEWSEDKNVKWKVEIPGKGHATPIVWKDKVFLVSAAPTKEEEAPRGRRRRRPAPPSAPYRFTVLCLERSTGKTLWKKLAVEEKPHEGIHNTGSFASMTPVTDGKNLYVSFGSRGIFCFDFEGEQKWKRDLGEMRIRKTFGEGSSLVIHEDKLIVLWDHEGQSYIYCLDAATGKDKWKVERNEASTWNTPLIVKHGDGMQVVVNGSRRVRSYDIESGKVLWECGGQVSNTIPAPVSEDGIVVAMSGHRGNAVFAIKLDAKGDVTDSDSVVWSNNDSGPYVPSPLLYEGLVYHTKGKIAALSCLDLKTGKKYYEEERLNGIRTLYAGITGAAGRVYIVGRSGTTLVVKHGKEFKVLATNRLDGAIDASPVLVGREIFLRSAKHLYCISEEK